MEEQQTEKITLFIPAELKAEKEYFQGFARKELIQAFYGSIIVLGIILVVYSIIHSIFFIVLTLLLGEVTVITVVTRSQITNLSVVTSLKYAIQYVKEQQDYRYRQMPEMERGEEDDPLYK